MERMTRFLQGKEVNIHILKRTLLWGSMMLIGFVLLIYQMCSTNGKALQDLTYRITTDTFYDFTVSIKNGWNREEYAGMYPPLIQLFFHALASPQ